MGNTVTKSVDAIIERCHQLSGGGNASKHPAAVIIHGDRYAIHKCIGEGGYAFVYEASDPANRRVALKRFVLPDDESESTVLEEVRIHQALCPHDHIVQYTDHELLARPGMAQKEVWVVMDLCSSSLALEVNKHVSEKNPFSKPEICSVLSDVIAAVAHMHSQSPPVSHWDVKIENLLFDRTTMKLCDFGSCTRNRYNANTKQEIATAEVEIEQRMTVLYRPPESMDLWSKKPVDTKADIWAIGVVLYAMLYLQMPFTDNRNEIASGVPAEPAANLKGKYPELEEILAMMLVKEPELRADIFAVSEALGKIFSIHSTKRIERPATIMEQPNRFA